MEYLEKYDIYMGSKKSIHEKNSRKQYHVTANLGIKRN